MTNNTNADTPRERKLQRSITQRIVIQGVLTTTAPTLLMDGTVGTVADMQPVMDLRSGKPYIPGTTIAGALRNYLTELERGYFMGGEKDSRKEDNGQEDRLFVMNALFGGHKGDEHGKQSPLTTFDAHLLSDSDATLELRDSVKIDGNTQTASDKAKFDMQVLAAGAQFGLRFELNISQDTDNNELKTALLRTLQGLEKGEIRFGARTQRGFGECMVAGWQVTGFDLNTKQGLLAWLRHTPAPIWASDAIADPKLIAECFSDISPDNLDDNRQAVHISATFNIDGSLLVRSGFGKGHNAPDVVQLMTKNTAGETIYVVPGSSIAGVMRHRATRIANILNDDNEDHTKELVSSMFGSEKITPGDVGKASHLIVSEAELTGVQPIVQTRVRIDRFTGGAADTALFDEQPVFATPNSEIEMKWTLRTKSDDPMFQAQVGMLLQLLKDFWTGTLAVGGGQGVGRGFLIGKSAQITINKEPSFKITATDSNQLQFSQPDAAANLNKYGAALVKQLGDGQNG